MIDLNNGKFHFGDSQQGPHELLRDLEAMSAWAEPNRDFVTFRTKNRNDGVERAYHSFADFEPPANVVNFAHNGYEILCSTVLAKFAMCHVGGICYTAGPATTFLDIYTAAEQLSYHSFIYNPAMFAGVADVKTRLAQALWGTEAIAPPPQALADLIAHGEAPRIDQRWMTRPLPFTVPTKDMSAFDEGLKKIYGAAVAKHFLKEIA